jgi:DeoR family transcriptional regulator, aga operon transcriptional repressor
MRREERFSAILEVLANGGSVGVAELAKDLGVASATIRRDLALLEQQRLLARTHGGAVAHAVSYELPLRYKGVRHAEEKRRIAREAALHVTEGMAVGLTGGTTATEVARALADREGLTIVTNALNIASELAVRPNLKLVVTGGVVRGNSYELSGPLAEASLAMLNLDIVFVGVDGIEVRAGCTTHHDVEAHSNGTMIDRSRQVVVVADSSKIGRVTFARICPIDAVTLIISDAEADPLAVKALQNAGPEVQLV